MFVHIRDLHYKYPNAEELTIDQFNLTINKGGITTILGESGSGKSTLLRLIAGLEMPTKGNIMVGDDCMCSHSKFVQPENRGIGMVFQDYALFPHMTVKENIQFGLLKWSRKEKKTRLQEVLELVNLEGYDKRYPYELSGGQQQRVALARALAPKPKLLLFDEPFSNLDADLQIKIREELRKILKTTGVTSIFVTHDQEDAQALADNIVILRDGKITDTGTPDEIFGTDCDISERLAVKPRVLSKL
ncbi:ABC transporter ATP-binding protein [Aquisalibacillus elongatus]|uniref:Carnitine transport ATP-binding protein OpuCA n=1 Tax=Aquisalibacillus elongatus TaxID=485577 RepID=A0A3N5BFE0_9BACI|nr:ABC transporter ATP-binding protein [Aquisalibacillus elongatus]RPF53990.1 iron(III) transport system ATP-binding protein [Aquisalibacillus elongatus]